MRIHFDRSATLTAAIGPPPAGASTSLESLMPIRPGLPLFLFALLVFGALAPRADAAPRDVQIVGIDFDTQVIELFNFGTTTEDLDGWRFCSHDATFVRRYSSSAGLNGVSIDPGASLFIHLDNDANGQPDRIDRPAGNWALPLDQDAYGLQLYFTPVSFGNGATIADHLQWSLGGADNATADERSDEAEAGGVWTDQSLWISTAASDDFVMLNEASNGLVLHGPSDYTVPEPGFALSLGAGLIGLNAIGRRRGHPKSQ